MLEHEKIDFKIHIIKLGTHKKYEDKENVIFEIRSYLIGKYQEKEEMELFVTPINNFDFTNFIEFKDITENVLMKWIETYSKTNVENGKIKIIESIFPTREYLQPPYYHTIV